MNPVKQKRVWIRAKSSAPEALRCKKALEKAFKTQNYEVADDAKRPLDLCLSLGGDGTALAAVRELGGARFEVPILAIHASWGLGFLQSVSAPDLSPEQTSVEPSSEEQSWATAVLSALVDERFEQEHRWGLEGSWTSTLNKQTTKLWALNDIVINKGALSRMLRLRVKSHDTVLIERLRGDGLIVSSATGSTAYSLSAGGPILEPGLASLVLTAICPHEVTQRPLVLNGSLDLKIELLEEKLPAFLTSDGQQQIQVHFGDEVHVGRAQKPLIWLNMKAPELNSKNFFERLRSKLRYGGD